MGELLGALGLAWPRLLLYPGGLFALLAAWLLGAWLDRCRGAVPARAGERSLIALVPPLAVVALLPLPPARSFPYGLDLVIALALLEWPRLLALRGLQREALARDYLPLLGAVGALAVAVGGVELTLLMRPPEDAAGRALLGAGAALWLAALPRLLADGPGGPVGRLRALGLTLLGALPIFGGLAVSLAGRLPAELAGPALAAATMLAAGLVLGALTALPEWARAWAEGLLAALALGLVAIRVAGTWL